MTSEERILLNKRLNYHEGILEYRKKEMENAPDEVSKILAQNHILNEQTVISDLKRQLGFI